MALPRPVQAPTPAPPRVGLLASALRPDDGDERWANGITYEPDTCDAGGVDDPCGAGTKTEPDANAVSTWQPYFVYASYKCSSFGFARQDWRARARSKLAAVAGFQIERELWTGTLAQSASWPNRYLALEDADMDILTPTAVTPTQALSCLEQYLGETAGGARGMIHATRQTVTLWAEANLVRPVGNGGLLVTANDTVVVPGAGYTGGDPNGNDPATDNVWAYATDMVEVRLSDDIVIGDPVATPGQVDRETNEVIVRAEQLALASWEGCRHAGARMQITVCDIAGS